MWQTLIGNYVSFFTLLPHTPPLFLKTWKIRILIKQKTIAGDIIILHMCTKNHNHMRYGSWDTEWNRGLFCHIGQFFALFPPKNTENQNFEDWKKHLEISSFYTCVPQMKMCSSWYMEHNTHNFLSFWTSFFPFTSLTTKKIKLLKKLKQCLKKWKKKELEISSFYTLYQKLWSHDARWTDRCMDGQTDRQTEKVTYRGGCST